VATGEQKKREKRIIRKKEGRNRSRGKEGEREGDRGTESEEDGGGKGEVLHSLSGSWPLLLVF
jgi:hypothetical protein